MGFWAKLFLADIYQSTIDSSVLLCLPKPIILYSSRNHLLQDVTSPVTSRRRFSAADNHILRCRSALGAFHASYQTNAPSLSHCKKESSQIYWRDFSSALEYFRAVGSRVSWSMGAQLCRGLRLRDSGCIHSMLVWISSRFKSGGRQSGYEEGTTR